MTDQAKETWTSAGFRNVPLTSGRGFNSHTAAPRSKITLIQKCSTTGLTFTSTKAGQLRHGLTPFPLSLSCDQAFVEVTFRIALHDLRRCFCCHSGRRKGPVLKDKPSGFRSRRKQKHIFCIWSTNMMENPRKAPITHTDIQSSEKNKQITQYSKVLKGFFRGMKLLTASSRGKQTLTWHVGVSFTIPIFNILLQLLVSAYERI